MKRKSGLHKKVSSIFGRTSLSDELSAKTPLVDKGAASAAPKNVAKIATVFTEDEEYAASQKRKLFLVIGLCVVLALVLFFNLYPSKEYTTVNMAKASVQVIPKRHLKIDWPDPGIWHEDIKDPMFYTPPGEIEDPFTLNAIMYMSNGRSSVLIGTEILCEGDEIYGWTIKEILRDRVKLENSNGEKLELKME